MMLIADMVSVVVVVAVDVVSVVVVVVDVDVLVVVVDVVVGAAAIASRLSELRSCVVSVLCSVISATVSKLRPMKLPVFFSTGRVL